MTPLPVGTRSTRPLLVTATSVWVLGLVAAGVTGAGAGRPAALGLALGVTLAVAVLAAGALALDAVASRAPALSLVASLVVYTLQLVALLLVLLSLERSGPPSSTLARDWLGGAVVAATLAWLVVQVWLFARARVPVYDDPAVGGAGDARAAPAAGPSAPGEGVH